MRRMGGALAIVATIVFAAAAPAAAAGPVQIDWTRTPPVSGSVVGEDAVVSAGETGGSFHLITIDAPPVGAPGYQIVGDVAYEGVQGRGYLQMWSVFEDGSRAFSRTLDPTGPMAALTGSSGPRTFVLPFNLGDTPPPTRLEIDVVLPGPGTVRVGPLSLQPLGQSVGTGGWWSDRAAGVGGAAAGTILGLLGAVIGSLASRGRARRFVLATMVTLIVLGCALAVTGVVALALSQPYAVYFPLLLAGVLMVGVSGSSIRTTRRAYAEAELRRIRAMDTA